MVRSTHLPPSRRALLSAGAAASLSASVRPAAAATLGPLRFSLDHVALAARNLYEAAFRLRTETGLGFYDGGYSESGIASKVFPLGGDAYLIVEGLVDPYAPADPANELARRFADGVRGGEGFRGLALRVDSLADLEAIARAHGAPTPRLDPDAGRILSSGERLVTAGAPPAATAWPAGLPIWNVFADMAAHPSGQPVLATPGLTRPRGVTWIEMGGEREAMAQWLGQAPEPLGLRFNGKTPGVHAIGVATDRGDITIRRPPIAAANRA